MSTMAFLSEVGTLVADVQTELFVFLLAIATHYLFFHKLRPAAPQKSMKEENFRANKPLTPKAHTPGSNNLLALKTALRAGDLKAVMVHFEALQGLFQKQESPSNAPGMLMEQIVKLTAQNGSLSDFLRLLVKLDLLENNIEHVLAYCLTDGDKPIDSALMKKVEELGRKQGVAWSSSSYQALIRGTASTKDHLAAERLMSEARSAGVVDIPIYNAYMNTMLKCSKNGEVRQALENMRVDGLQPNIIAFNKLLGVAVGSDPANVWAIVDEMKAHKIKPDNITCSILLKSRFVNSKAGNITKVLAILDNFEEDIDEVLFNSLVDACVRVGRADLLMPFLAKQRNTGGGSAKGSHTYASIIRAYGYTHDVRGAWNTWEEMKRQHVAPISVTLGCMMEALCTNGDVEGAYELVQEMRKEEETAKLVNAVLYGSICKGFSHQKNFTRMWQVYDEMMSLKLVFSMVTYNTLIDGCARSGDLTRIPQLLKDIDDQGLKMGVVTYSAILKGYCQKNLLDQAFALFKDMRETAGLVPDEIVFNTMLDGCARQGLYERGMRLFHKMKETGVKPTNFTLSVLVKLANRGKKLDKAFSVCDDVTAAYGFRLNVHVFNNLVQACCQHNSLQRGIDVLERMAKEKVRPDGRTYQMLLKSCVENRQTSDADGLLRAAIGLSDGPARFAQFPKSALQLQGRDSLSGEFVSEIVQGLMEYCKDDNLAAALICDLGKVSGLKLDPKLRLRLLVRKPTA